MASCRFIVINAGFAFMGEVIASDVMIGDESCPADILWPSLAGLSFLFGVIFVTAACFAGYLSIHGSHEGKRLP